jgi:hypothetical protein
MRAAERHTALNTPSCARSIHGAFMFTYPPGTDAVPTPTSALSSSVIAYSASSSACASTGNSIAVMIAAFAGQEDMHPSIGGVIELSACRHDALPAPLRPWDAARSACQRRPPG